MRVQICRIIFAALLLSMAGPGSAEEQLNMSARARVYQEAEITLYPGDYCYGGNNPDAIEASKTGLSIFSMRKRVGMPETGDIEGAYNEYVVEAGKPLTVMLKWEAEKDGVRATCGPIGATLYPQFGKDYDITIAYMGNCFVQVRELYETSPGKAAGKPAPVSPSFACLNYQQ